MSGDQVCRYKAVRLYLTSLNASYIFDPRKCLRELLTFQLTERLSLVKPATFPPSLIISFGIFVYICIGYCFISKQVVALRIVFNHRCRKPKKKYFIWTSGDNKNNLVLSGPVVPLGRGEMYNSMVSM